MNAYDKIIQDGGCSGSCSRYFEGGNKECPWREECDKTVRWAELGSDSEAAELWNKFSLEKTLKYSRKKMIEEILK